MMQPQPLSRREVLRTAALLGVGASLSASGAAGAEGAFLKDSGLVTGRPKPLKYQEIPGLLSREQVAPHYAAHYGGALRRLGVIEEKLDAMMKTKDPLPGDAHTYLHKDRLNRMNSVLLHELYFDNLIVKPPEPAADIRKALADRFGSTERWAEDFKACCTAAGGWGILARDAVNGKLYNVVSDLHEAGVIWLGQPLIVCDVYEHAFYVDYRNRKAEYVAKFVGFVDWEEINRRYRALSG
jgi:Fe-Mn family superoxide dismutase